MNVLILSKIEFSNLVNSGNYINIGYSEDIVLDSFYISMCSKSSSAEVIESPIYIRIDDNDFFIKDILIEYFTYDKFIIYSLIEYKVSDIIRYLNFNLNQKEFINLNIGKIDKPSNFILRLPQVLQELPKLTNKSYHFKRMDFTMRYNNSQYYLSTSYDENNIYLLSDNYIEFDFIPNIYLIYELAFHKLI